MADWVGSDRFLHDVPSDAVMVAAPAGVPTKGEGGGRHHHPKEEDGKHSTTQKNQEGSNIILKGVTIAHVKRQ